MVYVTIKEETDERLHLSRQPSNNSWAMLAGFFAFGLGAAYYGNDPIIWKIMYITGGVFVGISCMEDWEECEFDKKTGEIRLRKYSAWELVLCPITGTSNVIVAQLGDVIEVCVEDEKVNYFGTTHQVVLVFNSGMSLGITESFTFGKTDEHQKIAEKIRKFLDLQNEVTFIPVPTEEVEEEFKGDNSTDDSSGEETADDFEQIDKSELPADLTETSEGKEIKTDDTTETAKQ